MNLRRDAYHSQDTIGEVQHLMDLYSNNKGELEDTYVFLEKKVTNLALRIKSKREELLDFLSIHQLKPDMFPVLESVVADDVCPDTSPEQGSSVVEVEKAMRKNIPNELFTLLKDKIPVRIHHEVNSRIDELKRMKLQKSKMEGEMLALQQL
jgi:hypothetical protein